jgi:hypothetical protein
MFELIPVSNRKAIHATVLKSGHNHSPNVMEISLLFYVKGMCMKTNKI